MKNIHVFKTELPTVHAFAEAVRESEYIYAECGETDFFQFGFDGLDCVTTLSNGYKFNFCYEAKVIPTDVIKREFEKRAKPLEDEIGRALSKAEKGDIREQVLLRLVRKAMTKVIKFTGYYHTDTGTLIIDVSKPDLAQKAISIICHMLKSIQTSTLHVSGVSNSLSQNILECIKSDNDLGFAGFTYADKLNLKNSDKESVKFKCDYTLEHVQDLLTSGYGVECVRLQRDGISFDLTDEFKIKSIKSEIAFENCETNEEQELLEQQTMLELLVGITDSLVAYFKKSVDTPELTPPPADNDAPIITEVPEGKDPFYDEAVEFVKETRRASVASIQRKFRIGYNRAARMVEQMEADGHISTPGVNGSRDVLIPPGEAA